MTLKIRSFIKAGTLAAMSTAILFGCGDDGNPAGGGPGGGGDHFNPDIGYGSFVDSRDGRRYRTVEMPDGKTWMAENLNYEPNSFTSCSVGEPCVRHRVANTYGALYTWNVAADACPAGWRLPTNDDWADLINSVGGFAGSQLKSTRRWQGDFGATDEFGFSALPGGSLCVYGRDCYSPNAFVGRVAEKKTVENNNAQIVNADINKIAQTVVPWWEQTQHFDAPVSAPFDDMNIGVAFAEVLGDGEGRPDRIRLGLVGSDGMLASAYDAMIHGVRLVWPPNVQGGVPATDSYVYEVTRATAGLRFGAATETPIGYEMIINIAGLTSTLETGGAPLPTGHTSISGTGMGVVAALIGYDGDVIWNSNFNTHDGIGPIIASSEDWISGLISPLVIENTCQNQGGANCPNDVLLIQTSEGVRSTFTNFVLPGTFELARVPMGQLPTATTTGDVLIVTEASASGMVNGSSLTLAPTSPAPRLESVPAQYDYYLRFVPEAPHIQDFAQSSNKPNNNIPHAQNRWVKIELRPEPPRRNDGWYTANVVTGLLDTATVVFDKMIEPSWLLGATVVMGTDENVISQSHIETGRVVFARDTVKFCLRTFYPSRSTITTSGPTMGYNLRIIYSLENPATREWNGRYGGVDHALVDRAKPVLANDDHTNIARNAARIIYGDIHDGFHTVDTVVVWISEDVVDIATPGYVGQPLQFITSTGIHTPMLYFVSADTPRGLYRELKYVFLDNEDNIFVAGDSVRINPLANIIDMEGNIQDAADNRAVSLHIVREVDWVFNGFGEYGYWWSSTEYNANSAWWVGMSYHSDDVFRDIFDKTNRLLSVRCVRDD